MRKHDHMQHQWHLMPLLCVHLGLSVQGRPLDPNKEGLIPNVRATECTRLAWHPLLPLLAIGWKDGAWWRQLWHSS